MPWNISFLQSHTTVKCDTELVAHQGFLFVMTFQALDSALPSVVFTQLNENELYQSYTQYKPYVHSNYIEYVKNEHSRKLTFPYLSIGNENSFITTEVIIHITVMVYQRIILQSSPERFSRITIYDGPGTLSPITVPSRHPLA